ncbi:uncharacterized protein KY384_000766 [Bacidia gigantensis]|uniref:uncharacterized protein n=1 Tax=Bacidia gigantensis TaxID=2732470 RepID=UPI001D05BBA4|nr:uncharacterized protein KY384_000766 [Bacidia gigantensis]KAG8526004.1 hypothetical protein KY384_000766 [Bacidia gigantensis]
MVGFLDLPYEIRHEIYTLYYLSTRPESLRIKLCHEQDKSPTTLRAPVPNGRSALVATSKLVSQEAQQVFCGSSTWRISSNLSDLIRPIQNTSFFVIDRSLLQHVLIEFDIVHIVTMRLTSHTGLFQSFKSHRLSEDHNRFVRSSDLLDKLRVLSGCHFKSLTLDTTYASREDGTRRYGLNLLPGATDILSLDLRSSLTKDTPKEEKLPLLLYEAFGLYNIPCFSAERILVLGMRKKREWKMAHHHGFGCDHCPLIEGQYVTDACDWVAARNEVRDEAFGWHERYDVDKKKYSKKVRARMRPLGLY